MVIVDPAEADELVHRGVDVVLIVDSEAGHVARPAGGPGRLAVLVGPAGDPAVRAAAEQMSAELFRA